MKKDRGYSTIEIVIYVSIFAMLSLATVSSLIVLTRTFAEIRTNRDFISNGVGVMQKITEKTREAKEINIAQSSFGVSSGVLDLTSVDDNNVSHSTRFTLSNGILYLSEDGVTIGPITSGRVSVASLVFYNIPTTQNSGVKVVLTLEDTRPANPRTSIFTTTVLPRGK